MQKDKKDSRQWLNIISAIFHSLSATSLVHDFDGFLAQDWIILNCNTFVIHVRYSKRRINARQNILTKCTDRIFTIIFAKPDDEIGRLIKLRQEDKCTLCIFVV